MTIRMILYWADYRIWYWLILDLCWRQGLVWKLVDHGRCCSDLVSKVKSLLANGFFPARHLCTSGLIVRELEDRSTGVLKR